MAAPCRARTTRSSSRRSLRWTARGLRRAAELANRSFLHRGVTFTVYSDGDQGTERILPFDPIPRIVPADEWAVVEAGPAAAHPGAEPFRPRHLPRAARSCATGSCRAGWSSSARHFRREIVGIDVPDDQYIHVVGSDLDPRRRRALAGARGQPAHAQRRLLRSRQPADDDAHLPRLVRRARGAPGRLLRGPAARQPRGLSPRRAVPGARRRADRGGADARDLQLGLLRACLPGPADGDRARRGPRPLRPREPRLHAHDVTDGDRWTSSTAVSTTSSSTRSPSAPSRCSASRGCSAPSAPATSHSPTRSARASPTTRCVYGYVPAIIRYYLGEEPILDNVPTYLPSDPEQLDHVLHNLDSLVVKAANESGGYGMLIGPHADEREIEEFRRRIVADPAQLHRPARHPALAPSAFVRRRGRLGARSRGGTSTCGRTS